MRMQAVDKTVTVNAIDTRGIAAVVTVRAGVPGSRSCRRLEARVAADSSCQTEPGISLQTSASTWYGNRSDGHASACQPPLRFDAVIAAIVPALPGPSLQRRHRTERSRALATRIVRAFARRAAQSADHPLRRRGSTQAPSGSATKSLLRLILRTSANSSLQQPRSVSLGRMAVSSRRQRRTWRPLQVASERYSP